MDDFEISLRPAGLFPALVSSLIARFLDGLHANYTDESTHIRPLPLELQIVLGLELRSSPNLQLVRSMVLDRLEDSGVDPVKLVLLPR